MSGYESEEYHSVRDEDLDGFIVSDEEQVQKDQVEEEIEEVPRDRIREMTTILKPNETQTQKILKAHISVLVSALGGIDYTSKVTPAPYKMGHDALACLKDIKRWIRTVDQRSQSFDVALACAESGLLVNDLTIMLCQWDTQLSKKEHVKNARITEKIMLANLELMNQLTWPFELDQESSESQRLQFSNIKKAQILYKKHILHYNKGQTLKAVIRLVLQTMAKDKSDWEPRDDAILSLVLSFIRNILYIWPITSSISTKTTKEISNLENMPSSVTMEDISMNNVLNCFKRNKVLTFLVTVANSIGSDFNRQLFGPVCLESVYLIIKSVDPSHVVNPLSVQKENPEKSSDKPSDNQANEPQQDSSKVVQSMSSAAGMQLDDLLKAENKKKKQSTQNLSTRHGRFGTLLSIQGEEHSYVVSGQEALLNASSTMDKLDKSKKWNKAKTFRYDSDLYVKHDKTYLNVGSLLVLKEFINQFLVGDCFNNLISNVSALITSDDSNKIDSRDRSYYFLTIAWFLNYKHDRNEYFKSRPAEVAKLTEDDDPVDFSTIKAALSEVNFVLILNHFRESFSTKDWNSVHVAMVVFLQLLLISHTLFTAPPSETNSEDEQSEREMGEGVIRNLFTSYDFLNVLVQLPQSASKHSPTYLKTCIHIVHILLKAFESFAKENVKLYIQRRRKKAKSKGGTSASDIDARLTYRLGDLMDESDEEEDNKRASEETHERELDLRKTEERFFHTSTVSSYIDFLSEYEDLSHEEIKRCLSYFHRLFVVRKDYTGLYRLDFMYIIHKIRSYVPRSSSIRTHVDEFIVYFMKKFKVAFTRMPNPVELLFPRFDSSDFKTFLATGDIVSRKEGSSQPRLAKDIDFIREYDLDMKVKLLVTALFLQEKEGFISWFVSALEILIQQRLLVVSRGIADESSAVSLDAPDKFRRLFINNPYIRCILSLVKFELPDVLEDNCELPGSVATAKLVELLDLIKVHVAAQPITFEDGKDAFFFFTAKDEYGYNDDEDYNIGGDYEEDDNERIAFEAEGNNQAKSGYMEELDRLDQLEAQMSSINGSRGSGQVGIARKKNKHVEKTAAKAKSKSKGIRGPRAPRGSRGPSAAEEFATRSFKSAEFIHDSDDDSDDDRDNEFFAKEQKLRLLLVESGGIMNQEQLEEFKKVWKRLASDKGSDLGVSVSQAVATATEGLKAFDSQVDIDYLGTQSLQDTQQASQQGSQLSQSYQLDTQQDPSQEEVQANNSTRLEFSSDSESQPSNSDSNSESESGSESDNEATITEKPKPKEVEPQSEEDEDKENQPETSISRKRILLSDDEDSETESGDTSFVSANQSITKKRRAVIDDEDDE